MSKLRLLLLPFSWIYGAITGFRNFLFNRGINKTLVIPKKSILVGNLSTGGTGKTPHVDYLLNHFVNQQIKTTSLSRGYGRKTKGVLVASSASTANDIGDEPLFYKNKYGNKINVVVAEKRTQGVQLINANIPNNELIVLDDAFQHRAIKAGLNILLTDFNHLYSSDFVLPAGNLREWKTGAKRADILIVTKSPSDLKEDTENKIKSQLKFHNENVFFSSIGYGELKSINDTSINEVESVLLVTGIANPIPLIGQLNRYYSVEEIRFKDHHEFTLADIEKIHKKFDTFAKQNKAIITTEKDFMRLKAFDSVISGDYPWFYQPITIEIKEQEKFNNLIDTYVNEI